MKTLLLQIENEEDYYLFLTFAKRLNFKIIPTDNYIETDKEDIIFSDEMISELDRRHNDFEENPDDTYSMADVKMELENKFGRKLQTTKRS
ncbi:MAG: hypothetical protein KDK90_28915 [Leptospiraceae bacterium]|nr:hypothetical protein [Leptospiraceae bacterium]